MTTLNFLLDRARQYLTPPGEGVFTVHTASERRNSLQSRLFGAQAVADKTVRSLWESSLEKELPQADCLLFGIASDCGGGIQRGANWGPLFLRETMLQAGLQGVLDIGDVRVIPHLLHDKYLNQATISSCRAALYQDAESALPVSPLSIAEDFATQLHAVFPQKRVFMIGGDHSVSYPMVSAWLRAKQAQGKRAALVHFDAHTDLLQQRLGIDLCFGTWTSHVIPLLSSPQHLIQIGIRASGKERGHWESTFGHHQYWSHEVRDLGAPALAERIVAQLQALDVEELYISYDIDCLDQSLAGATGTPESGGMTVEESLCIIHALNQHFQLTGADMVEIAPMVRPLGITQPEPETTLASACALSLAMLAGMQKI